MVINNKIIKNIRNNFPEKLLNSFPAKILIDLFKDIFGKIKINLKVK